MLFSGIRASSWMWITVLLLLVQAVRAQVPLVEVLHRFNPSPGGRTPTTTLVQDAEGSFYGTTSGGGASGLGTIFKLDSEGVLTTLHSFQGSDGADPFLASLTPGADGSLYGTTAGGGISFGVIFRISLGPSGPRLPGDCNADGSRDLSDAICLLGFLFLGAPERLPCGSGLPHDASNLQLLDHNGDQKIDLSDPVGLLGFLFLGGPPPRSGLDCVEIAGCSAACPR